MIERKQESVSLWNACECGRVLTSIHEGKRGTYSMCWFKAMPSDTKQSLNRLLHAAITKVDDKKAGEMIDDAMSKLQRGGFVS